MKKVLYAILMWTVRLTWCLLDSLVGFFIFIALAAKIRKIKIIANTVVCRVDLSGPGWGLEGGIFIFSNSDNIFEREHLLYHEFGHCWPQALVFGPLHIFTCFIPSAIRFWVRIIQAKRGKTLKPYDAVWFENTASKWGATAFTKGVSRGLWN